MDIKDQSQYCSHCDSEMYYTARYPRRICGRCMNMLTDKKGRPIVFHNTEFSGHGCQGYYRASSTKEKYNSNAGYIGKKSFTAEEARFGGIIIQLNIYQIPETDLTKIDPDDVCYLD